MSISENLERSLSAEAPTPLIGVLMALLSSAEDLFSALQNEESGRFGLIQSKNVSGDIQSRQDVSAHEIFSRKLASAEGAGVLVSEESDEPRRLGAGKYSISLDPFDGSKAYRYGIPPGTIFGIFEDAVEPNEFSGNNIICSGVFTYSQRLELILYFKKIVFIIDRHETRVVKKLGNDERFLCANLSNINLWPFGWAKVFQERVLSANSSNHHNSRWFGSLATHVKTTVLAGGAFAYPPDQRAEYKNGHLRLVYEAIPVAKIIHACGGKATNGTSDILDIVPSDVHQKTPLAFGEAEIIEELQVALRKYPQ